MKTYFLALFSLLFSLHIKSQKKDLPVDFSYIMNKCLDSINKSPFEKKQKLQYFSILSDSLSFDVVFVKNKNASIISNDFIWMKINKKGKKITLQTDNLETLIKYKVNQKGEIVSLSYSADYQIYYKAKFVNKNEKWVIEGNIDNESLNKTLKSIYEVHYKIFS